MYKYTKEDIKLMILETGMYDQFEVISDGCNNFREKIIINDGYGDIYVTLDRITRGQSPGIMTAVNKNEYFLGKLKIKNPEFFDNHEMVGDYISSKDSILFKHKYGLIKSKPNNLISGKCPFIGSALDKQRFYENMIMHENKNIYNQILEFGEYKGIETKTYVINKYGKIIISPKDLRVLSEFRIYSAEDKHSYFLNMLKEKNDYVYKNFRILGKYESGKKHILIENKYGKLLSTPSNLLSGSVPNGFSAINKTEYYKNTILEKNPSAFNDIELIEIKDYESGVHCKDKYGELIVPITCLKQGFSPSIESAIDKDSYSVERFKYIHKNKYEYPNFKFINSDQRVYAHCKICNKDFEILYSNHTSGYGCTHCNKKGWRKTNFVNRSKNGKAFLYVINIFDENESFYKIGITTYGVKRRFCSKRDMPYKYKIIKSIEDDAGKIWEIEKILHEHNKENKYLPKLKFSGHTECFTNYDLNIPELEGLL